VRKLRYVWRLLRGELRATSSLISLAVLSVLTVFMLTQGSSALAYPSFQSPESPVQSPAATPAPSEVPPEQPPQESPVAPPPEVPVEIETPLATPQATSEQTPIGVTPVPTVEGEEASPTGGVSWAVLIDTLVVGLSSIWLCCGGLALVLFVLGVIATFLLRAT
jgi:hypothetical protein